MPAPTLHHRFRHASRHSLRLTTLAAITLAAGCATTPPPPPTFNAASSAEAQAATFIAPNKEAPKYMKKTGKLAVTSCNVMFAQVSSASASTGAGLFGEVGVNRAEAKVIQLYTLTGLTESQMQTMANSICTGAEDRLRKAGFEVVSSKDLNANANFQGVHKAGKKSPFEFKAGQSKYLVFAPTGQTVFDPRYIGVGGGLSQAFKQASGESSAIYEGRLMDELGADSVNINVLVDFAQLQSSGNAKAFQLGNKDSASVSGEVKLSISGDLSIKPKSELDCWTRFGKRECMLKAGRTPAFKTKLPVTTDEKFYKAVVNATTTGDKAAAVLTKGLSMISALGGVGGVSSTDVTRYNVEVDAAQFEKVSRKYIDGFLDMAFLSAKSNR
ncbi:MAG: hypothetical protein Q8J78_15640 [Moraxellaceae bacterium]|nr:hypothetical protein [Moraxellaceae bacterium]